ncbi:MAG: hypothetical protein WKF53_11080, partial [Rubrobacter sp.]
IAHETSEACARRRRSGDPVVEYPASGKMDISTPQRGNGKAARADDQYERLRDGVAELRLTKRQYPFHYPFPPSEVVEHFRTYYGPTNRAFAALDGAGQAALRRDLEQLWTEHNSATDSTTRYDSEYLEVIAVRE